MPLKFDVAGIGAGNANTPAVSRIPLGANTVITSIAAVYQNGGPVNLNIVYGEAAENGTVAGNGQVAVSGNQVFTADSGQVLSNPGVVYSFTPPTSAQYNAGTSLTLRAVTPGGGPGVGGLTVLVYTTADTVETSSSLALTTLPGVQVISYDVEGVGAMNTNLAVVGRIPLGLNTVITAVTAVCQTGSAEINIVSGESAESGVVPANNAVAVAGNQLFASDTGQNVVTPGAVYTFTPSTSAIWPLGSELTLRVVTGAAGVGGLKVLLYTYALTPTSSLPVPETSFNPIDYQPQVFYPFGMPYQPLGQWLSFNPETGAYTYTISPGFTLGSLYFPDLTAPVEIFAGAAFLGPAVPFYTTGNGGAEVVPLPSGLTQITLYAQSLDGATMPFFVTSSIFDPDKTTPSGNNVSSVSAAYPLTSTGGSNPVISITDPLPVLYGGTGSTSPSLVSGAGIAISGTWPNQTVTAVVVGPYVGSVTASLPLTSSGGLNPNIALDSPLPVSNGGTGQTAPSLVAGTNITITGTWPNQTVTATAGANLFYNYNTSTLGTGVLASGTATTSTGGAITINLAGAFATAALTATANATGGTPYIINCSISGKTVTFTAYSTAGTATVGVPFYFQVTGD